MVSCERSGAHVAGRAERRKCTDARSCEVEFPKSCSIVATITQALSPRGLAVVGAMLYLAADRNAADCVQIAAGVLLASHVSAFATARDRIRNATHIHTYTYTRTHTHVHTARTFFEVAVASSM